MESQIKVIDRTYLAVCNPHKYTVFVDEKKMRNESKWIEMQPKNMNFQGITKKDVR
ncbi:hypothetical protein GCM10022397_05500 [Flavivirga jejuensis]